MTGAWKRTMVLLWSAGLALACQQEPASWPNQPNCAGGAVAVAAVGAAWAKKISNKAASIARSPRFPAGQTQPVRHSSPFD